MLCCVVLCCVSATAPGVQSCVLWEGGVIALLGFRNIALFIHACIFLYFPFLNSCLHVAFPADLSLSAVCQTISSPSRSAVCVQLEVSLWQSVYVWSKTYIHNHSSEYKVCFADLTCNYTFIRYTLTARPECFLNKLSLNRS